jgi:hypothetical protein
MHACAATGTYSSGDRGLRHVLGMSDPVAQVTCRLSKGEALIVISFTSLALWTVIVTTICSLAPALFHRPNPRPGRSCQHGRVAPNDITVADLGLYPVYAGRKALIDGAGLTYVTAWSERVGTRPGVHKGMNLEG